MATAANSSLLKFSLFRLFVLKEFYRRFLDSFLNKKFYSSLFRSEQVKNQILYHIIKFQNNTLAEYQMIFCL